MRSYFVYVRTKDNQFFSGYVIGHDPEGDDQFAVMETRAREHFASKGNPLPRADMILTMNFVSDCRNSRSWAEWERDTSRGPTPRAADSYCVVSEYEAGVTITH